MDKSEKNSSENSGHSLSEISKESKELVERNVAHADISKDDAKKINNNSQTIEKDLIVHITNAISLFDQKQEKYTKISESHEKALNSLINQFQQFYGKVQKLEEKKSSNTDFDKKINNFENALDKITFLLEEDKKGKDQINQKIDTLEQNFEKQDLFNEKMIDMVDKINEYLFEKKPINNDNSSEESKEKIRILGDEIKRQEDLIKDLEQKNDKILKAIESSEERSALAINELNKKISENLKVKDNQNTPNIEKKFNEYQEALKEIRKDILLKLQNQSNDINILKQKLHNNNRHIPNEDTILTRNASKTNIDGNLQSSSAGSRPVMAQKTQTGQYSSATGDNIMNNNLSPRPYMPNPRKISEEEAREKILRKREKSNNKAKKIDDTSLIEKVIKRDEKNNNNNNVPNDDSWASLPFSAALKGKNLYILLLGVGLLLIFVGGFNFFPGIISKPENALTGIPFESVQVLKQTGDQPGLKKLQKENLENIEESLAAVSNTPVNNAEAISKDEEKFSGLYRQFKSAQSNDDFQKLLAEFDSLATNGHVKSQYMLAKMYDEGLGTRPSAIDARRWYLLAADGGNVDAMYQAGNFLMGGVGGNVDVDSAIYYYELASTYNHLDSQFNLGLIYMPTEQKSNIVDVEKSYFYFTLAANNGDSEAKSLANEVVSYLSTEEIRKVGEKIANYRIKTTDRSKNIIS